MPNYEAIGVRFVVENANGKDVQDAPFPAKGSAPWPTGPRLVYRDSFAEIWELPAAAPVFSLHPPGDDTVPGDDLPAIVSRGGDQLGPGHCALSRSLHPRP